MKRGQFVKELTAAGCYLKRHGSRHDIYQNPATGKQAPVPRHPEIQESLCRLIRNQLEIPHHLSGFEQGRQCNAGVRLSL